MGTAAQGRMTTHQQKKLDTEQLIAFRDRFAVPLTDAQCDACQFVRPPREAPEMAYLHARREKLGGYLPARVARSESLATPKAESFGKFALEANGKEMSTTVAYVRMVGSLLKDAVLGKRIVPIIADEARTFGMADLFRQIGIYSPIGQLYQPEDSAQLSYYKEAVEGQILEEGINEAGALASWVAAATSYSAHGQPMLPMYIYYSMFGFQRVGDEIWAAADSRSRGFLLGATAGRTTLSGEGLQHEDGTSHLVASTIPNCRAYDPCYAYELAVILEDGMKRMLADQEDVFYYVTLMNESYAMPSMPEGAREGILRGMHRIGASQGAKVRLLGAGTILNEVTAAAQLLEKDWGIAADVFSVTSFTQLRRDGRERGRVGEKGWIAAQLPKTGAPVVAACDYVSAVADLIRPWIADKYVALGTDGFGRSDTRANLRRFFEVDRHSVVVAALAALDDRRVAEARERYGLEAGAAPPWAR
jgi:pyruvate dehydrogenase E1 component